MIKAIFFDLWDTLFFDDTKTKPLEEFAKKLGRNFEDYKFLKAFERNFMIGKHRNFRVPIREILKELKINYDKELFNELYEIMRKSDKHQKPFPETLKILKDLKRKYKIVLISNVSYLAYHSLISKYNLSSYFDLILPSYRTKILKPDSRIFKIALDRLNIKKEDAIMVGDNIRDDVIATEKFGIKGILIDRKNKHLGYPKRIESLKELKKFL
jgi:putative hydrolase of the HAD superfamily